MSIKISKVIKELNVGASTIFETLRKKNITVDQSPNARIENDVFEMLRKEFKKDMEIKTKSKELTTERQKERKKQQPKENEEIPTEVEQLPGVKIVGSIDVSGDVKPAVEPTVEEKKPEEEKKEETPKVEEVPVEKSAEAPEEAPVVEKPIEKPIPKEEPVKVAPEAEVESPVEKPEAKMVEKPVEEKEEKVAPEQVANKSIEVPEEKDSKEAVEQLDVEDEIFTLERKEKLSLNVVGKIDLSAINTTVRPKKKSKEELRKERLNKAHDAKMGDSMGRDRKKRKRIGAEKVDIEKQASNPQNFGGGRGPQPAEMGKKNKDNKNEKRNQRHPIKPEVSEEDVQRQVKETLARLTNKVAKKGSKWRKEKREANITREREAAEMEAAESKVLKLTEFVTANDLAVMMNISVNQVIATCMNLGVMVSINQRLDAETINIVADEFGFKTEFVSAEVVEAIHVEEDDESDLMQRPPIVTVMGHVDHGKTSLLDYIRKANVIAGEAGGITQHIGAYNVKLADGRRITFLDTPGHEAFTAMRARGAKVTDIVIIIVAADDSVMPQTIEAINHASAAGVPIVFAINKIDKPGANPEKIKEELANMNYLVEDWGGKYQSQEISAKKGTGVEELMEKVLLEAEMLDLKANPNRKAVGSIIESSLDKGRGYVATVLVETGTLHIGDIILAGTHYGKVKAMFNERNQRIKEAGPSAPALVLGLNGAPTAGDKFNVMDSDQEAREIANKREQLQRELGLRTQTHLTLEEIGRRRAIGNFKELNIIVKGDVDGSIEALSDSLIKLSTEEIQVNVIHKAVGEISESDVTLAAASDAVIIGFQVRPSIAAKRLAEKEGVDIRLYSIIYAAIEEVTQAMEGMLAPEVKEEILGTAEVLQTYRISKVGTIAGAIVRDGKIKRTCKVRLIRDGIVRYTGELGSLKRFKDDAKEVLTGYDCGLNIAGYNDIKEGDMIEAFEEVEVKKSL